MAGLAAIDGAAHRARAAGQAAVRCSGICVGMQVLFERRRRARRRDRRVWACCPDGSSSSRADPAAHGMEHRRGVRGVDAVRRPATPTPGSTSCTLTPPGTRPVSCREAIHGEPVRRRGRGRPGVRRPSSTRRSPVTPARRCSRTGWPPCDPRAGGAAVSKERARARAVREAAAAQKLAADRARGGEKDAAAHARRERRDRAWRRHRLWQHGSGYRRRKEAIAAVLTIDLVRARARLRVHQFAERGAVGVPRPARRHPGAGHADPRSEPTLSLILLPAVDVADGAAVRLVQGAAGSETSYGDPLEAALAWQRDGAEWIHLVDLDAAFGRGDNRELLADVVRRLDVAVELSGGIRDDASLDAALATGCARVNLGTAALESPDWVRSAIARHGEQDRGRPRRSGHDTRRARLDAGGRRPVGDDGPPRLRRVRPLRGHRRQPRRHADRTEPRSCCSDVCARTSAAVVASGGVSSLDDLRAIAGLGTGRRRDRRQGAVRGAFTLPEALAPR